MSEQTPTPPPPFSFPDLPFSPINSNPNPSSSIYTLPPFPAKRKRTGFHRKASNPSFSPQSGESSNPRPNPSTSVAADLADEIIVINKEATTEAVTALSAGFPADSLTDEEIEAGVVSDVGGIEQVYALCFTSYQLISQLLLCGCVYVYAKMGNSNGDPSEFNAFGTLKIRISNCNIMNIVICTILVIII